MYFAMSEVTSSDMAKYICHTHWYGNGYPYNGMQVFF